MAPTGNQASTNGREAWSKALQDEYTAGEGSGVVGSVLVSETDRVRVWHLYLPVGTRCNFHTHVLDYFWTALTPGKARGYYNDGRIVDVVHYKGDTKHFKFGPGESFTHSVENIGDTDLIFTTVEFLDGANPPTPVPDSVRLQKPAA